MQVKWVSLALLDVDSIAKYISNDSPDTTKRVLAEIARMVQLLKTQPNLGQPGRVTGTREIHIFGTSYIIPYRVIQDEIQILRVLHTSRQWPKSL